MSLALNTSFSLRIAYIPSPENLFASVLLLILTLSKLHLLPSEALSSETRPSFRRFATEPNHNISEGEIRTPLSTSKK